MIKYPARKHSRYFVIIPLSLLMSCLFDSCSLTESITTKERLATRDIDGRGTDAVVLVKPIIAELDIAKERASATYVFNSDSLGISNQEYTLSSNDKETAKNFAKFKLIQENNCDYILDPIYYISTVNSDDQNSLEISVSINGYLARYKSFYQPDSLPSSIKEANKLNIGNELIVITSNKSKSVFKPYWSFGFGLNRSLESFKVGTPDAHLRYTISRRWALSYDYMNMRNFFNQGIGSKNHLFSANLNLYSKKLSGVHFLVGPSASTYDGIFDFDGIGFLFGIGGQKMINPNIAIRADYRSTSQFGASFSLAVTFNLR